MDTSDTMDYTGSIEVERVYVWDDATRCGQKLRGASLGKGTFVSATAARGP